MLLCRVIAAADSPRLVFALEPDPFANPVLSNSRSRACSASPTNTSWIARIVPAALLILLAPGLDEAAERARTLAQHVHARAPSAGQSWDFLNQTAAGRVLRLALGMVRQERSAALPTESARRGTRWSR
jgi:hypothetical protein